MSLPPPGTGHVALVTGASSGIGEHMAREIQRAGDENAPLASCGHVLAEAMQQRQRTGDVGVNHLHNGIEILIEKGVSQTVTGIGQQGGHRPPTGGRAEPLPDRAREIRQAPCVS